MSKESKPVVDPDKVAARVGTGYPAGFDDHCRLREKKVLGDLFGLEQFGVNLTTLPPGQWSALRHWHRHEDEFVYVVDGDLVLIDDGGEHDLKKGMCAGFRAGVENGHHLVNRSGKPATYLEIGSRAKAEQAFYPDDDLLAVKDDDGFRFTNRAGKPYDG